MLHVWYIYHICVISRANVGTYSIHGAYFFYKSHIESPHLSIYIHLLSEWSSSPLQLDPMEKSGSPGVSAVSSTCSIVGNVGTSLVSLAARHGTRALLGATAAPELLVISRGSPGEIPSLDYRLVI